MMNSREIKMTNIAQHLEPHLPRLRRYAHSLVRNAPAADDLVQSTILRALEKQHHYRVDTNLHGWLMTIMHNEHANEVRRQMRIPSHVTADALEKVGTRSTQDAVVELREIRNAVARLPVNQRELLLLHSVDGLRYDEIAARIGIPLGTVQSRIWRARTTLRALLADPKTKLGLAHQGRPQQAEMWVN
jgi:RNA polymerase sigma-70 factor (ECF subfamily)